MNYKLFNKNIETEVFEVKNKIKNEFKISPSNNILLILDQLDKLREAEGVYVELGTFRGSTLLSCAEFTKKNNIQTTLYGIDTFEGFPETNEFNKFDLPNHYENLFKNNLISKSHFENAKIRTENFTNIDHLKPKYFQEINNIKKNVLKYDNIKLIESEIKNSSIHIVDPIKILFFDCDLYDSYMEGLKLFYDKVITNGAIIFDEYYSFKYPGALQAVIDFFDGVKINLYKYITSEGFERYIIIKK